ncbi:MAG: hypothetical protein DSY80_01025 [Desulfocapsa sp.]|nr:MAG: hypothetical protein DSY80_01025 [Desulfocapsa sp.]
MTYPVSHGVGDSDLTLLARSVDVLVYEYTYADLDSSDDFYIPLDADTIVEKVGHLVTTAFTGGTPAIIIGDGDDDNGYLETGVADPTAANDFVTSKHGSYAYSADGVYYSTPGFVRVGHATGLTAGAGKVIIWMTRLNQLSWRQEE